MPTSPTAPIPPGLAPQDSESARVQRELDALMIRDQKPWASIGLLIASAMLFIGIGFKSRGWTSIISLAIVIFFHELGHFLTMKHFGYRKVRMFFIPMLGAATSGQEARPSSTHQAIVSIMGPVPGILFGILLMGVAAKLRQPVLTSLSWIFIGLNVLNLLPVSPLDGGHFFEAILFSRHPLLEVLFKTFALIVFILFIAGRIPGGMYVIYALIIALIAGYRRSQVAYRLRKTMPPPPESENPDYIPTEWVKLLVKEVKTTTVKTLFSGPPSPKLLAIYCRDVWQRTRTQQAGLAATSGLLALYISMLFISIAGPRKILQTARTQAPAPPPPSASVTPAISSRPVNQITIAGKTILVVPAPWTAQQDPPNDHGTYYRLQMGEPPNAASPVRSVTIGWLPLQAVIATGVIPNLAGVTPLLERVDLLDQQPSSGTPRHYAISEMKAIKQSGHPAWAVIRVSDAEGQKVVWRHRFLTLENGVLVISDRYYAAADPKTIAAILMPLLQSIKLPPQ